MITIDEVIEMSLRLLQRAATAEAQVKQLQEELAKCKQVPLPPKE